MDLYLPRDLYNKDDLQNTFCKIYDKVVTRGDKKDWIWGLHSTIAKIVILVAVN